METGLIIVLGLGLAISLAFNLGVFGGGTRVSAKAAAAPEGTMSSPPSARRESPAQDGARKLEAELEKKRKELEDTRKAFNETKDELKAAKKKLFEQRESEKSGDDLARARAEVERQASIQLENTRHELANALAEIQRLKAQEEGKARRRAAPAEDKPAPPPEKPREEIVVQRVIRELSDVEKERIARLEQQSSTDRKKANELERELRSQKAKLDRLQREGKRVYAESNLTRDKFRAVEVRLNRTLLENDLLRRAIVDLEKKTGAHAEHTTPTAEELAESDRKMSEKHAAEDRVEAEARARLEATPAREVEEDQPAPSPETVAAAATPPATVEPAPAST